MNDEIKWEKVVSTPRETIERLKIHRGWIVRITEIIRGSYYVTSTWVPDLHHEWEVKHVSQ